MLEEISLTRNHGMGLSYHSIITVENGVVVARFVRETVMVPPPPGEPRRGEGMTGM